MGTRDRLMQWFQFEPANWFTEITLSMQLFLLLWATMNDTNPFTILITGLRNGCCQNVYSEMVRPSRSVFNVKWVEMNGRMNDLNLLRMNYNQFSSQPMIIFLRKLKSKRMERAKGPKRNQQFTNLHALQKMNNE